MPNLRGKTWTENTPAQVTDANFWEDHLISDEDAEFIDELRQGGGSAGHTIYDGQGVEMPRRNGLEFINAEVTDDSTNNRTIVDCQGEKGDSATIQVGTVTTGEAGTNASVTNVGTTSDAIFNFVIPRGAPGSQGPQGVQGETGSQGPQGIQGETGNGISRITKTSTSGLIDTYTIYYTDGTSSTFEVRNGADGQGAGDMTKSVYDTNDNGIVDNAEKVDGFTVARNVLANEYTNAQIDNKLTDYARASEIPTNISDLTNDSNYQNGTQVSNAISSALMNYVTNSSLNTRLASYVKSVNNETPDSNGNVTIDIPSETTVNVTLLASGWNNGSYTITNSLITANNVVTITYPTGTSIADFQIIGKALIMHTAQAVGSITIEALGTVPTSDITIQLIIRG